MGATDCPPMDILAMICGVIAGGALTLIGVRHLGWDAIKSGSTTLLDPEAREAYSESLDRHDKRLLMISAVAFSVCILFLVLGYS